MKNTLRKWLGIQALQNEVARLDFDAQVSLTVIEFLNNQVRSLIMENLIIKDLIVKTPTKKEVKSTKKITKTNKSKK